MTKQLPPHVTVNTTPYTPPSMKRVPPRGYTPRPLFWFGPERIALFQSQPHQHGWSVEPYGNDLRAPLTVVSQWCHANECKEAIIYLMGGHDAASTQPADWYRTPLTDGWRISNWRTGPMSVTYDALGVRIHVRVAAAWFDEADAGVEMLADNYRLLQAILRRQFGPGAYLLGTPAQTGLDLLEQSLPFSLELPALPADLRELIQHNSPQGRNEVLTAPDGPNAHLDTLDSLVCYDAKWMYAACTAHIPAGRYEHRKVDAQHPLLAFDPWAVGFYRVGVRIPDNWQHIGLLPMWDADEKKTVYPWEPGTRFECWATGAELQLADEQGWAFVVHEEIVWPQAQKLNPLKTWRDKLIECRRWAEEHDYPLLATAIRHIMIDALGALARRSTPEHHITPKDQIASIPDAAYNRELQPWGIEWDIDRPLAGWAARFQHPEIPAMVWGRARTRLAKFALKCDREQLILGRTDAWWTNGECIIVHPTKALRPGDWRVKDRLPGPGIPAPRTTSDALARMREARIYTKVTVKQPGGRA